MEIKKEEELSQLDTIMPEIPTLLEESGYFEALDKMNDYQKSDNNIIEFKINKLILSIFSEVLDLANEFIDILCINNTLVVYTENSGRIFASRIALNHAVKAMNFRIPSQLLRYINQTHSLMRIFVYDNQIKLYIYKEDMNKTPLSVELPSSIAYAEHFNLIQEVFAEEEFGIDNLFTKVMPALVKIYSKFKQISKFGLVVQDGVAYIDTPECKAYADLGVKGLNIVLPYSIMQVISKIANLSNCRFEIRSSYNILRSGQFIYAWKSERVLGNSMFTHVKNFKYNYRTVINPSELTTFIKNIQLSKNRDQFAILDFDNKEMYVSENDLINFRIPFDCGDIESKVDQLLHTVNIDMKTFLQVAMSVSTSVISVTNKYIMLQLAELDDKVGQINYYYVLQIRR